MLRRHQRYRTGIRRRWLSPGLIALFALTCTETLPAQVVAMGGEFPVNTYTTGGQSASSVAVGADGSFVVVWESELQDGDGDGVFGQAFLADGTPVASEFQVNVDTSGDQSFPDVAVYPDGSFRVAWISQGSRLESALCDGCIPVFPASTQINTYVPSSLAGPKVRVDSTGRSLFVWSSVGSPGDDDSGPSIQGRTYDAGMIPNGPQFQVNTYTTGGQALPDAAFRADGSFCVVWSDDDPSGENVHSQLFDSAGNPAGPEQVLGKATSGLRTSVATRANDGFVVVWDIADWGYGGALRGRLVDSAGYPQGGLLRVDTAWGFPGIHSVAADKAGNFVVAWGQFDYYTGDWYVPTRTFDRFGNATSDASPVSPASSYNQKNPSIGMNPDGSFVVVWQQSEPSVDLEVVGRRLLLLPIFQDGFESGDTLAWSAALVLP